MVEVLNQWDAALEAELGRYLALAGAPAGACMEHDPAWLCVLRESLGHRPIMLLSRDAGGSINGYLPLALVATSLFGRFLVSLPYLNRAGVVATDAAVKTALIDKAVEIAGQKNVKYLELRHDEPTPHAALPASRNEKVRMVLELPASADALWKSFDAKVRNQIRKGDKHNLTIRWGGQELLDDFYRVFAINMRDLGTPVYSRKLFASILQRLDGGRSELAVVNYEGQAIAGALLVHEKPPRPAESSERSGTTQVPSASSLREHNATCANMWMYHQMLVRSIERGSSEFDFGRSSEDSGTYKFKKQWGAKPRATVWQYHIRRGDMNAMRPDNPSNQRKIAIWQRLPLWLTLMIGPGIVRGIP